MWNNVVLPVCVCVCVCVCLCGGENNGEGHSLSVCPDAATKSRGRSPRNRPSLLPSHPSLASLASLTPFTYSPPSLYLSLSLLSLITFSLISLIPSITSPCTIHIPPSFLPSISLPCPTSPPLSASPAHLLTYLLPTSVSSVTCWLHFLPSSPLPLLPASSPALFPPTYP